MDVTKLVACAAFLLLSTGLLAAEKLKEGSSVGSLQAVDQDGNAVDLASFKDKKGIVLFFYPKADTPGCTAQSCGYRDDAAKFTALDYQIFGASRDKPAELKKFIEKYKFQYPMLSDPEAKLAGAFGFAPGERSTVIIGKDGTVKKIFTKVSPKTTVAETLKEIGG